MIEIRNLTKSYSGHKKAVDNLSIKIAAGDIYGFIGSNGSGKTTTLKALVGIHEFDSGEILIDTHCIKKDKLKCKSILAYIPDNPDLYENITGKQYLNFIADIYGVSLADRKNRTNKYGDLFEMTQSLNKSISAYSHGMKQRLALISALIHKPKLLIMDEPFVGLDPKATFTLKEIMNEIVAEGGAIFFSTHVLDVAEIICNKIAIINNGKLIASGYIKDVIGDKSLESVFMDVQANG